MRPRRLLDAPDVNITLFAFLLHLLREFWQVPFFEGMASAPHWSAVKLCTRAATGDALIAVTALLVVAAAARSRAWIMKPTWRTFAAYIAGRAGGDGRDRVAVDGVGPVDLRRPVFACQMPGHWDAGMLNKAKLERAKKSAPSA